MFLFLTYYFQINLGYTPVKAGSRVPAVQRRHHRHRRAGQFAAPAVRPEAADGHRRHDGHGRAALAVTSFEQDSSWVAHVLPAELVMSVGMALVFVPLASLSLVGIGGQDAGVASAMLNTSQQVGGALGTALLTTIYAGAVTRFLTAHPPTSKAGAMPSQFAAFISGYHHAFLIGACLIAGATLVTALIVRATKDDVEVQEGAIIA